VYDDLKTGDVVAGSSFVNPITKLSKRYPIYDTPNQRLQKTAFQQAVREAATLCPTQSCNGSAQARQAEPGPISQYAPAQPVGRTRRPPTGCTRQTLSDVGRRGGIITGRLFTGRLHGTIVGQTSRTDRSVRLVCPTGRSDDRIV